MGNVAASSEGEWIVNAQHLEYKTADALYIAARRGDCKFFLHYHDRAPRQITGIGLGDGCVWVEAGPMLAVHIRPDGTSKDGPAIWLEAEKNEGAEQ